MEIPSRKLVRLLHADHPPEVRAAAALVLGELGLRDAEASAELVSRLRDDEPEVRLQAIRAVGKLRVAEALPVLRERIPHGGPEGAAAAEAAAALGAKGLKALQELLHRVVPGVRKSIAVALASSTSAGAGAACVGVLLDKDPQVSGAAAAVISASVPTLPPARKAALAEELVAAATDAKKPLAPATEAAVVRVLVSLGEASSAAALWEFALPPHAPEVRAAALQFVAGGLQAPTKPQWAKLFACALDADFRVAAPALAALARLPVNPKMLPEWVTLFAAPDGAARRTVIDKLGDIDAPEVAAGLMEQLRHSDRGVREAAQARLAKLKAGRKAVLAALQGASHPDDTWFLARLAANFAGEIPPATRKELVEQVCAHLLAGEPRADALLYLLKAADAGALQDDFLERAIALRKQKKYEAALGFLKVLARDPSVGFAVRLELAFCGVRISGKELDPHARDADACLRNFATLFAQDAEQLRAEIEQAKFLEDEDLYYVGFHFAEQIGRERAFGAELLTLVLKRSPKGEYGKSAKNKLKAIGA